MRKARSRAGLTLDVVAERMGASRRAVSKLESTGLHAPLVTPQEAALEIRAFVSRNAA